MSPSPSAHSTRTRTLPIVDRVRTREKEHWTFQPITARLVYTENKKKLPFLFNFLIVFEFHIMHSNPIHLPMLSNLPLQPPPKKKTKTRKNKPRKQAPISLRSFSVPHRTPFFALVQSSLANVYYSQPLLLHVLASPTLSVQAPHWGSSHISCCCPVSWGSAALDLQDQPHHALQQFIDGVDVGVANSES